jgi:hypothetical protein
MHSRIRCGPKTGPHFLCRRSDPFVSRVVFVETASIIAPETPLMSLPDKSATTQGTTTSSGGAAKSSWWSLERLARLLNGQPELSAASAATANTMLPVLIEVFAAFSKLDGNIEEEEVESSLGYLRYDYPEAIYADMRRLYFEALQHPQDLTQRAKELSQKLSHGAENPARCAALPADLALAAESAADGGVLSLHDEPGHRRPGHRHRLSAQRGGPAAGGGLFHRKGVQPLDTLRIGSSKNCDVLLRSLSADCSVVAFRFQNLVLLKNTGSISILVRSRRQPPGEFSRLYPGERVVLEDVTLDYNDLFPTSTPRRRSPARRFTSRSRRTVTRRSPRSARVARTCA